MDDTTKQTLLNRFQAYLDEVDGDDPEAPEHTTDLYSLFVEVAGLRSEVRTEARLVKDALDQFRAVFATLESSQATLQQELDRARADSRDQANAALRPLLLDMIDLRDRLLAARKFATTAPPPDSWFTRLLRSKPADRESWLEGLQLTLRRFDQVLADRRVVPVELLGKPLDPRLARVVTTTADRPEPDGTVIEELRPGFVWDDQVLRSAEVIVSKRAPTASGDRH